jgi:hypothetical protein
MTSSIYLQRFTSTIMVGRSLFVASLPQNYTVGNDRLTRVKKEEKKVLAEATRRGSVRNP